MISFSLPLVNVKFPVVQPIEPVLNGLKPLFRFPRDNDAVLDQFGQLGADVIIILRLCGQTERQRRQHLAAVTFTRLARALNASEVLS